LNGDLYPSTYAIKPPGEVTHEEGGVRPITATEKKHNYSRRGDEWENCKRAGGRLKGKKKDAPLKNEQESYLTGKKGA